MHHDTLWQTVLDPTRLWGHECKDIPGSDAIVLQIGDALHERTESRAMRYSLTPRFHIRDTDNVLTGR